jgi:hypothetical protein
MMPISGTPLSSRPIEMHQVRSPRAKFRGAVDRIDNPDRIGSLTAAFLADHGVVREQHGQALAQERSRPRRQRR